MHCHSDASATPTFCHSDALRSDNEESAFCCHEHASVTERLASFSLIPTTRYNIRLRPAYFVGPWASRKELMPTDIIMPQMGESIVEGTITKWLKKPGDKVQRDEPLFEISTDKVDAEIPAPASGVLHEIKVTEGTTVGVNTIVGTIAVDGEAAAAAKPPASPKPAETNAGVPPAVAGPSRPRTEPGAPPQPTQQK